MTAQTVIRSRDDLVDMLRARKAELGLSNGFIEDQLQMCEGGADKVLGPSRVKGMSLHVMFDLVELLGCRLVFQVDPDTEARMRDRWERRDEAQVRAPRKISKVIYQIWSKQANEARSRILPGKYRSEIARNAVLARWKKHRRKG